jgi:hypothetical protein
MKKFFKNPFVIIVLIFLAVYGLSYLAFSFILWTFDTALWRGEYRVMYILLDFLVFSIIFTNIELEFDNH